MAIISYIIPTQPKGSIDGVTYYKNGGQLNMRQRSRPTVKTSNARTYILNKITVLSDKWEIPLSNAQRIAWGTYAFNSPLKDAYNNNVYVRGYAHYMRSNRPRLQFNLPRVDEAPTLFGFPNYTLPTYEIHQTGQFVDAHFNTSDEWANESGGYMMLWQGLPTAISVNRPPEIYQPLGFIAGSASGVPSPARFYLPTPTLTAPWRTWIRSSITRADGRLSGR